MQKVRIIVGWRKGQIGMLIREYTEEAFGVDWATADVQIMKHGKAKIIKVHPSCYEIIE